ncbi:uncharacterized protein K489DRAFT_380391 [Dissoconium aciculare CBS 342.82]|jgi:hypothetical protein|uniref:Coenzyme Q-binding protein COQ10 START domain-containing protein n=1 Tax=Dissoconium aciculare CBS 342.82 TaxID=1314786 RepID=A0A6J3M4N8_9PEZI|nr:uncharacterized protein K489DRAFT_380391 [Dissoconium aciculare CBS 342.82]KAF1822996.1 hypothetical protein K489DRAFT_380391 [Dissoconium aciculare CBS 342.82]
MASGPKPPVYHIGLSDDSFHDPAHTGPRPTHHIPNGGKWSLYASTTIPTPPKYVYDALVNVQEWKDWNTYIPHVRITKHPKAHHRSLKMEAGTSMTFTVAITPEETLQMRAACTYCEKLKTRDDGRLSHASQNNITRIRWSMDNANSMLPGFVMKTERVNEIIETEDANVTRYRTWQAFGGLQAKSYQKKYGEPLKGKFVDWCEDLKKRAVENYEKDKKEGKA